MKPKGPKYQQKSYSIPSPEQDYFAGFAMRYPVVDKSILSYIVLSLAPFLIQIFNSGQSWAVRAAETKIIPKCSKYAATYAGSFFMLSWAKIYFLYPSVCTKNLNSFRMRFF